MGGFKAGKRDWLTSVPRINSSLHHQGTGENERSCLSLGSAGFCKTTTIHAMFNNQKQQMSEFADLRMLNDLIHDGLRCCCHEMSCQESTCLCWACSEACRCKCEYVAYADALFMGNKCSSLFHAQQTPASVTMKLLSVPSSCVLTCMSAASQVCQKALHSPTAEGGQCVGSSAPKLSQPFQPPALAGHENWTRTLYLSFW